MEIFRSGASRFQESLNRAWIDITNIGGRLDGTTVGQTFDKANDGDQRKLDFLQERALILAETLAAMRAVQTADGELLADLLDHAEVAGREEVETSAIRIGTRKSSQRGYSAFLGRRSAYHERLLAGKGRHEHYFPA